MKHLKLFEKKDSKQIVENTVGEYEKIGNLIRDCIKFENPNMDIRNVYYYYYESNFIEDGDVVLITCYTNMKYQEVDEPYVFAGKELEDLYEFIDNPGLYKETRKYNL